MIKAVFNQKKAVDTVKGFPIPGEKSKFTEVNCDEPVRDFMNAQVVVDAME